MPVVINGIKKGIGIHINIYILLKNKVIYVYLQCKNSTFLGYMGRRKKQVAEETPPKRKKRRYSNAGLEMALIEFVRAGYSAWKAEKITNIHHTTIQRAWENLSMEEKKNYQERVGYIADAVSQTIITSELDVIKALTAKLKDVSDLALEEIEARLKDPLRRMEIKDADLINIITKGIALVKENTQTKDEENAQTNQKITQVFNILDQSIQEHLTISSMSYEEQ